MTVADLKSKGAIYFDNIKSGFDKYKSETVHMKAEEAEMLFHNMWIESGQSGAYVDFYYYRLNTEEQGQAEAVLTDSERSYLKKQMGHMETVFENIIFPLDETLLSIVSKWNESAMLFSTVYFL